MRWEVDLAGEHVAAAAAVAAGEGVGRTEAAEGLVGMGGLGGDAGGRGGREREAGRSLYELVGGSLERAIEVLTAVHRDATAQ